MDVILVAEVLSLVEGTCVNPATTGRNRMRCLRGFEGMTRVTCEGNDAGTAFSTSHDRATQLTHSRHILLREVHVVEARANASLPTLCRRQERSGTAISGRIDGHGSTDGSICTSTGDGAPVGGNSGHALIDNLTEPLGLFGTLHPLVPDIEESGNGDNEDRDENTSSDAATRRIVQNTF